MSAESELELKIAGLDPKQFERLVFDLVHDEFSEANALSAPDMGADTLALASNHQPARVWQAKHFNSRPNWAKFAKSMQDAIAAFAPQTVTFVFSRDLTGSQTKTFNTRLRAPAADAGVAVDYWSLSALRDRLQRNPHVRVRYFGYETQTLMDVFAAKSGKTDALTAVRHLDEFFGAEDPGFEYEVEVLRPSSLPDPAMVEDASATFILRDGPRIIRAAVNSRDADSGPMLVWNFADDEQGSTARDDALLATARGDAEVAVDAAALTLELRNAPKPLRDQFEQTPRNELIGRFVFTPGPGIEVTITAHGPSGEALARAVTVYPFPPAPWRPVGVHDHACVGIDGAFMAFFAVRLSEQHDGRSDIAFLPYLNLGTSATANAQALRFWRALVESERVELAGRLFPGELMQIHPGKLASPEDTRRRLAFLEGLYQSVTVLEERLALSLPVHPPPISEEELLGLDRALTAVIDQRIAITIGGSIETTIPRETVAAYAEWLRSHPPVALPLHETVFGSRVELGHALGPMPDVHIIEIPRITGGGGLATLRVLMSGSRATVCRVLRDGENPPSDAVDLSNSSTSARP